VTETATATRSVRRIPEGFHALTPHLTVKDAAGAIDFYKRAFGAVELSRAPGPDGNGLWHADLMIGDSHLFLNDEFPDMGGTAPPTLGGTPVTVHLFVEDADEIFARAVGAGATVTMPIENAFWGDRYGIITDPYGHSWSIASRLEDLTPEEMMQRAMAMANAPA
jgi:uncharacterized glyoxalase superfamily protein PhnB